MNYQQHFVFAERHCHEQSLAYYCETCDRLICSHCSNDYMFHDYSHVCIDNDGILHRYEIVNELDEEYEDEEYEDEEYVYFDEEYEDNDNNHDAPYSINLEEHNPHFITHSGRNI